MNSDAVSQKGENVTPVEQVVDQEPERNDERCKTD